MSAQGRRGKHAMSRQSQRKARRARGPSASAIALSAALVAVAAVAATYALVQAGAAHGGQSRISAAQASAAQASAAQVSAAQASSASARAAAARVKPGRPAGAAGQVLWIFSVAPSGSARHPSGAGPIEVAFSARLAANSSTLALSPNVKGPRQAAEPAMVLTPVAAFCSSASLTMRAPAGLTRMRSATRRLLAEMLTSYFRTKS